MKKIIKAGDILQLVRVRFPGQINPGTFLLGDIPYKYGQKVLALSEQGPAVGFINSQLFDLTYQPELGEIHGLQAIATVEDELHLKEQYQQQRQAKQVFLQLVSKYELPMEFLDMEASEAGQKLTFYYKAPERVDFRDLVKDLNRELRMKIELRQVARSSCHGVGPCGVELCTFINSLMGEDKKKCNEFHCRLEHKDPFYEDKKSRLPKVGEYVATRSGDLGRVERVELWKEEFVLLTSQGIRRRYTSQQLQKVLNKKDVNFPKEFEHITDESRVVIGQDELVRERKQGLTSEIDSHQEAARAFAQTQFKQLFADEIEEGSSFHARGKNE